MYRRQLLRRGALYAAVFAGCSGARQGAGESGPEGPSSPTQTPTPSPTASGTTSSPSTDSPDTPTPTRTVTEPLPGTPVPTRHAVIEVPDCDGHGAYWVDAEPVAEPGPKPLRYRALPPGERRIVRTAVGPVRWARCDLSETFISFRDRVMARRREVEGETVSLRFRGEPYCLVVWAKDLQISTCPPPD